jgi:hypothetical protein
MGAQLLPFLRYGREIDTTRLSVGFIPIALAPGKNLSRRTIGLGVVVFSV